MTDDGEDRGGAVHTGRFYPTPNTPGRETGLFDGFCAVHLLGRGRVAANSNPPLHLVRNRVKRDFADLFFSRLSVPLVFFHAHLGIPNAPSRRVYPDENRTLSTYGPVGDSVDRVVYEDPERVLILRHLLCDGIPDTVIRFYRVLVAPLEGETGNGSGFFDGIQPISEVFSDPL